MYEGGLEMSSVKRAACALTAAAVLGLCAGPSVATAADPTVNAATAQLADLGLTTLTAMPSGRTTYRTYDQIVAEMEALATTYPDMVAVKTSPHKSIEGRTIKYIEITNNVSAKDGKPVFFNMGAIHGNETPAAEDSLEFAYDVLLGAQTNPKIKALFDKVRFINMPVVNADGHVRNRRANCAGTIVPPSTCDDSTGVDMNRNYPFGWGSNIGVSLTARGSGPGSEPEVKNTMEIVQNNQVVNLVTQHSNSRAVFYPGLDVFAGDTPDLNNGFRDLALAMAAATNGGYTNVRRSALDYETSGETVDWSYYATRGFANTLELVGSISGCPQALPNYLNCTMADYTGSPPAAASATQKARFTGFPVRNALYLSLIYAVAVGRPLGHQGLRGARRDAEDHEGLQPLHGAGADRQHASTGRRRRRGRSRPTSSPRWSSRPTASSRGTSTRRSARRRPSRPTASTPARAATSPRAGRSPAPRRTARCWRPTTSRSTRARRRTSRSARRAARAAPFPPRCR